MTNKKYDLVTVQNETNALLIYGKDNVEKLISDIEKEVKSVVHDVTTAKGRKDIASMAYKVSQSKTALDSLGKKLVSQWKDKSKAVDAERKLVRDRFDALRDEVRAPLTEYEEAEKQRIEKEKLDNEINESYEQAIIENDLFDKQEEDARIKLEQEIARQKAMDEKQAELDAKQAELDAKQKAIDDKEAEQKQKEREAEIAKAAEEKAVKDAELKAKTEKEASEKREADLKREVEETEARVKREAEEEKRQEAEAAQAREANKKHKASINNAAVKALTDGGMNESNAKKAITLIAKKLIPNVAISY